MNVRRIGVSLVAGSLALLAMLALLQSPSGQLSMPVAHAQERPTLTPSPEPPTLAPPTDTPTPRPREDDDDDEDEPTATATVTATPEPPTAEPAATAEPPTAEPTVAPAQLPRTGGPDTTTPMLALFAGLAALLAGTWLVDRRRQQ